VVLLAPALAAANALAIALLSPAAAVGPDSIWQAYVIHDSLGIERVVLVGGDTLLALGPALCVIARRLGSLRAGRWVALLVLSGLATGATGTRTNIIAGTIALLAALALDRFDSDRAPPVGRLIAGVLAGLTILLVVGFVVPVGGQGIAQSVTARFNSASNIQQSLQYRADESARLEQALQGKMILGLGTGGTFVTEVPSTFGFELGPTLWAHNGYLWIMLKVGIVGLILFALGIWLIAMRLWQRRAQTLARAGLVWLIGILVLSISTNRFNDAGAGMLLALTFAVARPRFTPAAP
jgi:O-antigen ligase